MNLSQSRAEVRFEHGLHPLPDGWVFHRFERDVEAMNHRVQLLRRQKTRVGQRAPRLQGRAHGADRQRGEYFIRGQAVAPSLLCGSATMTEAGGESISLGGGAW